MRVFTRPAGEATTTDTPPTSTGSQGKGPTVPELRDECRRRGLRNFGKLRKAELIILLKGMEEVWACLRVLLACLFAGACWQCSAFASSCSFRSSGSHRFGAGEVVTEMDDRRTWLSMIVDGIVFYVFVSGY